MIALFQTLAGGHASDSAAATGFTLAFAPLLSWTGVAEAARKPRDVAPAVRMAAAGPVRTTAATATAPAAVPTFPLLGVVSLSDQKITIYSGVAPIASAPISSGMDGHRTPKGVFSIIQKNRYHESNIYSGAPMPFMQRLTWSGIALHAGNLPGYPASHGCVRLPEAFASQLFGLTKMGARVIVTDRAPAPELIAHGVLPVPVLRPAPQLDATEPATAAMQGSLIVTSALAAPGAGMATALLNPVQYARAVQQVSKSRAIDAAANAQDLQGIAATAAELHREAKANAIEAQSVVTGARQMFESQRARADRALDGSEDRAQAEASLWVAEELLAESLRELDSAQRYEREMADDAMGAAQAAKSALTIRELAEDDARVSARGSEPVSVLISRKTRRIYVRQGFEPVLEASVDIADEDAPIGTHVFTAIGADAAGRALTWSGVSVPDASPGAATASVHAALQRVQIPVRAMQAISERAWVGASVMISDHAPSLETGKGTDFILLMQ